MAIERQRVRQKRNLDHIEIISPYTSYRGNKGGKVDLATALVALMPRGKVGTFVDLFGGTGIVGINAFWNGRCRRVIYNDLEYDLHLLMRYLHRTPIEEIMEAQEAIAREYFPEGAIYSTDRDAEAWAELLRIYNDTRLDLVLAARAVNKRSGREMVARIDSPHTLPHGIASISDEDPEIWVATSEGRELGLVMKREDVNEIAAKGGTVEVEVDGQAKLWKPTKMDGRELDGADLMLHQADYPILLFTTMNAMQGTPRWSHYGKKLTTQKRSSKRGEKVWTKGQQEKLERYVGGLQVIADFEATSSDFVYSFVNFYDHERPRDTWEQKRFNRLVTQLGKGDFVFIDPPYHGSSGYSTGSWKLRQEVYLLAMCEIFNERGISWMMTNNIDYNQTVFDEWIGHDWNVYTTEVDYSTARKERDNKSTTEVIVTNYPLPDSKARKPIGLRRLTSADHRSKQL